jgi:hypothetical protein
MTIRSGGLGGSANPSAIYIFLKNGISSTPTFFLFTAMASLQKIARNIDFRLGNAGQQMKIELIVLVWPFFSSI